jgi:hypothetical protein
VLPQLAKYLLKFHQVHIPTVGTIRLVPQPAVLDVVNKQILPPHYTIRFSEDGWLTKHQLYYFGTQLHFDETATRNSLQDIGNQLKKQIELAPMTWNSIGTFRYANDKIEFEPHVLPPLLQPVAAERVLREGVQHDVLVGDTVVRSDGTAQDAIEEDRQWKWNRIAGWAAVILSVFFIIFYLYLNQFQPTASGLHKKTGAPAPEATYRE